MKFVKSLIKNRKLIWNLGKSEFKNRFASTSLGSIWGFLHPFVFMATYVIVFQYILKTGSSGDYPYVVWFLPGMAMWMWLNDSILLASNSIRNYSYFVKKIVFPVEIIPVISIVASSFVSVFLVLIATISCIIYGFLPNILMFVYVIFATYFFVISLTKFTSVVTTIVPDFLNLLNILMQLFMWFTPIVWNLDMLTEYPLVLKLIQCTPFTYLVTAFRQVFIDGNIVVADYGLYTIVFWIITILMYLWGERVFKRNRKDFADVL